MTTVIKLPKREPEPIGLWLRLLALIGLTTTAEADRRYEHGVQDQMVEASHAAAEMQENHARDVAAHKRTWAHMAEELSSTPAAWNKKLAELHKRRPEPFTPAA